MEGSPERALDRAVIRTGNGDLFILEKFPEFRFDIRNRIALTIELLHDNGFDQVVPSRRTVNRAFLPFFENHCYQLTEYVFSDGIERPGYLASEAIGKAFTDLLIRLDETVNRTEWDGSFPSFYLPEYIIKLFSQMKKHDRDIHDRFIPVLNYLDRSLFGIHDQIPQAFCHGDLHPLNVLWDGDRIKALIDWEFCGMKPDIYDAANFLGCAGIDDPTGLGKPMAMTFISILKDSGIFSDKGWQCLPDYLLALRFAWLSEWLRKKDRPMINMELTYMNLLMDHMDIIKKGWGV